MSPTDDAGPAGAGLAAGYALVVGEALVDVVGSARVPGGSPANVALGLGRLSRDVDLLTWLGDDPDGATVRAHLASSGVHVLAGTSSPARTSVATAHLDASGAATYGFDLEWDLPDEWATRPAAPAVVHTGSLAAGLEPGATRVEALLRRLRETAVVSYDPNLRPALLGTPGAVRDRVERLVALADVVKVSDEDLAWLRPGSSVDEVARSWVAQGPSLVVLTRGAAGASAWTRDGVRVDVPAVPVPVVDTVGAGDSFMAALLDGLWSLGLLDGASLAAVDADALGAVLRRCVQVAAVTVSRRGANPPGLDEVPGLDVEVGA